ncbi:MAG: porin family protein [Pseudomonadota bacterium]
MKKVALASALLLTIGSAHATDSIRWNSLALSYQATDLGGELSPTSSNTNLNGVSVKATTMLDQNAFLTGEFTTNSDDEDNDSGAEKSLDYNTLSAGIGYRIPLTGQADLYSTASVMHYDIDSLNGAVENDRSDTGYGLNAGVKGILAPNVEVGVQFNFVDIGDYSDRGHELSAMYHFSNQLSAGATYESSDNIEQIGLSGIFFF